MVLTSPGAAAIYWYVCSTASTAQPTSLLCRHRFLESRVCPDSPRSTRAVRLLGVAVVQGGQPSLFRLHSKGLLMQRLLLLPMLQGRVLRNHPPHPIPQVTAKVALDQLLLSPIMTAGEPTSSYSKVYPPCLPALCSRIWLGNLDQSQPTLPC